MNRSLRSFVRSLRLSSCLGLALLAGGSAAVGAAANGSGAEPVRVLVRFDRLPTADKRLSFAGIAAIVRHRLPEVSALALELPANQVELLRQQPGVSLVEPDPERHAFAKAASTELNPTLTNGLYGLVTTKATLAHKRKVTGVGATVCVADEGLDVHHPDIAPNFRGGLDLVNDDDDPDIGQSETQQHGTHVAGIMVAALNKIGVRGVAYSAKLYHARVLNARGSGNSSDIMGGIRRLVDDFGCRIVNLSLGGSTASDIERSFYSEMAERGVLIVAAAGNESTADTPAPVAFPAAYPGVLAVGAVDVLNQHADFSNTGEELDLSAPGVNILSSVPRDTGRQASIKTKPTYSAIAMDYSGLTKGTTGRLVDCGFGNTADEFPAGVAGNLALVRRDHKVEFKVKVENAMNAGAKGAIVMNDASEDFGGLLGNPQASDGRPWIPAVGVSDVTGETLLAWPANKTMTLAVVSTSWLQFSGTSMASPMVAGIAGLLLGVNPSLSATDVADILEQTATPLGGDGYNTTFGYGLVDADAAVKAAQARH